MPGLSLFLAVAARLGVPERFKRLAAIGLATVALASLAAAGWGAFKLWDWFDDRKAVIEDRNKSNAALRGRVIQADRAAGAAKDARDRAFDADQDRLKEKADEAKRAGRSPLDAMFDELRNDSGAGGDGEARSRQAR